MKTLQSVAKLIGQVTLTSRSSFVINGLGYRHANVKAGENFTVHGIMENLIVCTDKKPVCTVPKYKTLLVSSRLENGSFVTTLHTF